MLGKELLVRIWHVGRQKSKLMNCVGRWMGDRVAVSLQQFHLFLCRSSFCFRFSSRRRSRLQKVLISFTENIPAWKGSKLARRMPWSHTSTNLPSLLLTMEGVTWFAICLSSPVIEHWECGGGGTERGGVEANRKEVDLVYDCEKQL